MEDPGKQKNPGWGNPHALVLTADLKELAGQVVDAYNALSLTRLKLPHCNLVQIEFDSRKTLARASSHFLRLKARDASTAVTMVEELKTTTQTFADLNPVTTGKADALESDSAPSASTQRSRPLIERAQNALKDLNSCRKELETPWGVRASARLARLATRVNDALQRVEDLRRRGVELVRKDSGPPIVNPIGIRLVGLGPSADLWLGVPWPLALAPEVVALCQRILRLDTGEPSLRLKGREVAVARLYFRLFSECRPMSYRVPVDELVDDETNENTRHLQRLVVDYLPLLRSFLSKAFLLAPRRTPDEGATLSRPAQAPAKELTGVKASAQPRIGRASPLEIVITDDIAVLVDNKSVRGVAHRAVLWIASQIESGATSIDIRIWDFVQEIYGKTTNAKYVNNTWIRNRDALGKINLSVQSTSGGNWMVSNFRFQFGPKATKAAIKERLAKRSPQSRRGRRHAV